MKPFLFIGLSILIASSICTAQKTVLSYDFDFQKKNWIKNQVYIMPDEGSKKVAMIFHDSRKADYVLTDNNFKTIKKFSVSQDETVYNEGKEEFLGASVEPGGMVFHFVYKITVEKYSPIGMNIKNYYRTEKVDFNAGKLSHKDFMEIPKSEKLLMSFSDNGSYFSITTNDKTSDLVLHKLTNGNVTSKNISFRIPEGAGKRKNELSEYLAGIQFIPETEEADLDAATGTAKLFSIPGKLVMMINDKEAPTHIFTIDKNTFASVEQFIDHSTLYDTKQSTVNSFLSEDKIFSLVLNKSNIQLAAYNRADLAVLWKQEINEGNIASLASSAPIFEKREGEKKVEKDVENIGSMLKSFDKLSDGLTVSKSSTGQFILTVGTYEPIMRVSGGSSGYKTSLGTSATGTSTNMGSVYANTVYTPGISTYSRNANHYKTTSFKLLLEPSELKVIKGRIPSSVSDQVKDFMVEKKGGLKNQFTLNGQQYMGYYDNDAEMYIIYLITIKK